MEIICTDIAKKFRKELLFSEFNYHFKQGLNYAILGPNSSGKSTMLKIIASMLEANQGNIEYLDSNQAIDHLDAYKYYSFCSPEMQLFNEFKVQDILDFHFKMKKCKTSVNELIEFAVLGPYLNKSYAELSSGLKNKLKLTLALFSDTPTLFLDEPCTNFDAANISWYQEAIDKYCKLQMIVIASNQMHEHLFCENKIQLNDFKK